MASSVALSAQERRVAEAVARGATNKAIARELGISIKTVEFHLHNIYAKTGATSRVAVAQLIDVATGHPAGTVTFLVTDVEDSALLWEHSPRLMVEVMRRHDELARTVIEDAGGYVFGAGGEGLTAAFWTADAALDAACHIQGAIAGEAWPEIELTVRIGLDTGAAEERGGDYFGAALHRAARITALTPGRQVVASGTTMLLATRSYEHDDLGTHRLEGFDRPEHLLRLLVEGAPVDVRPLRTATGPSGNLVTPRNRLVGREVELAVVDAMLRHRRHVTLVGSGGVGKTRLALEAAAAVADRYPDGTWIVELAEVGRDRDVVGATALALRLEPRAATSIETLTKALRGQRRLIVVDNCEHLHIGAGELVAAITANCPDVGVLATSRQALCLDNEQVLAVPPLALARDGISDAATLFCERARAMLGGFDPTADELDQVEAVASRLDGLPLAIELAASRLTTVTLDELADQLAEPLAALSPSDASTRHESLRDTITWSYELLEPDVQLLLDGMSVFAGEVDLAMAEAVLGDLLPDCSIDAGLATLADHSLLTVRRSARNTRYVMLDTLRQFGGEQLEVRGQGDQIRRRYLDHVVTWAERAHDGVCSAQELRWHRAIADRWHHVRHAIDLACRLDDGDAGCRLIAALLYWAATRLRAEFGGWSEAVLALPSAADHRLRPAVAMSCSYFAHLRLDTVTSAERCALAITEEVRLGSARDPLLPVLAGVVEPDAVQVRALAEDVQVRAEAVGSEFWRHVGVMQVLLIDGRLLGAARPGTKEWADLVERARDGVVVAEAIGAPNHIAFASLALGLALRRVDPGEAVTVLERAHELATAVGNQMALYQIRADLALAYTSTGRYAEAVELLTGPLRRSHLAGSWTEVWWALIPMIGALAQLGHVDVAAIVLGVTAIELDTRRSFDLDDLEAELRERLGPAELERLKASRPIGRPEELVSMVLEAAGDVLS